MQQDTTVTTQEALVAENAIIETAPVVKHTSVKPWLVWTGVVGAVFAVLALFALVLLGQRVLQMDEQIGKLSTEQQSIHMQSDQLLQANQSIERQLSDQLSAWQQAQQDQALLVQQLKQLQAHQQAGWRLTDVMAIRFTLAQLETLSQVNPQPTQLKAFLQQWQQRLLAAGMKADDALNTAIEQEISALRIDIPTWQSQQADWQSLSLHVTDAAVPVQSPDASTPSENEAPAGVWEKLARLVKIRPAGMSETALADELQHKTLWPLQTRVALELIRVGLMTNQAVLVQQSAEQLEQLITHQGVSLSDTEKASLTLWRGWQGFTAPSWSYLHSLLAQRGIETP